MSNDLNMEAKIIRNMVNNASDDLYEVNTDSLDDGECQYCGYNVASLEEIRATQDGYESWAIISCENCQETLNIEYD